MLKRFLLIGTLMAVATGAYAQGLINLGNISNSGTDPTATAGGLFWDFCLQAPMNTDFNVNFYGGSDANSLVLLKSLVNSGGGAAGGPGTFLDLSGQAVAVPGALTSAFFRIDAWIGGTTFLGPGTIGAGSSPVFINPLGNPLASPPGTPTDFTGMPAILIGPLTCLPEPSTFAVGALGAVALLTFRRRSCNQNR